MNIQLGIYESSGKKKIPGSLGWKIVCEQEKTPFKVTDQPDCPVIVFDGDTPDWFAQFMQAGGIAVVTDCRPDLLPFEVEYAGDASIENADLTELGSSLARVQCLTRLYRGAGFGNIRTHEKRITKTGITQDEFPVFLYSSYGEGGCFYTGLPLSRLVTASGDTLRTTASFSNYSERIASIDKHLIIKAMREILIRGFHQRGLPYVHLGYFPGGYQSVLTFRIDVDGPFGENLLHISRSARDHGFTLTLFVNKSLCKDDEDLIRKIDPVHEVGNHANIHNLFPDYDSNYRNVKECKDWLNQLGFKDNPWFAAPRGMWNDSLHEALNHLGYLYTSDFGVAIAGFPFFPYIQGIRSGTLQIPVNPFSTERAAIWRKEEEKQEIDPEFIADFFLKVIDENYQEGSPIMIYSHPEKFGQMAEVVFQQIQQKIADMNIWNTTLTHFANWWFRRDQTGYSVEYDPSTRKTTLIGDIDADVNVKEI
jgi:peptidoglycan/xylan/chitin deacetylase (PgdA/CDA1 family)